MKGGLAMRTHSFRVVRAARGVTLLELLIVVTLLGILAAIAVPSYWAYVLRGQRTAAKTALMQASQYLERNYTTSGCYPDGTAADCPSAPAGLPAVLTAAPTDGGAFTYAIKLTLPLSAVGGQAFLLTATPCAQASGGCPTPNNPTFDDADCAPLTLDNTGKKGAGGNIGTNDPASCWNR
jgi:type IV pilus assembly protein PilE